MTFETKFALGQEVHIFARRRRELFDACPVCGGRGKVHVQHAGDEGTSETYCPNRECRHGKVREVWYDVWEYAGTSLVGQIEVRARRRYEADPEIEERYMLDSTGVGTGTVYPYDGTRWSHSNLFATKHEGEEWAVEQNKPLRAEANEKLARAGEAVAA